MIHAPIHGSQINPPAKLFKRFTGEESIDLQINTITYENNYYRTFCNIRYVEATEKSLGEYQPISGLVTPNGYMTIKLNGEYEPRQDSLKDPRTDDLIMIKNKLWIIESVQKVRIASLRNFAVIYLSLKKIL